MTGNVAAHGQSLTADALAAAAMRGFFRLAKIWKLSEQEQMKLLGLTCLSTIRGCRNGEIRAVSAETMERISYLLGIFKAINILLPNPTRADEWMRAANNAAPFAGSSALDLMVGGNLSDLQDVRRYLDAQLE